MEDLPSNLEKLLDSIRLYERRKDSSGNRPTLAEDIKINVIEPLQNLNAIWYSTVTDFAPLTRC